MDSENLSARSNLASEIGEFLDPGFMLLPPTIRFPYHVVANGQYGMCALVLYEAVVLYDKRTGNWYAPDSTYNAREAAEEAATNLSVAARGPADRVTALVWIPHGLHDGDPLDGIVASPEPKVVAAAIQDLMVRRLSGSNESTKPWLGGYISAALGSQRKMSPQLRRLIAAAEMSIGSVIGDMPIVAYGHELGLRELMDPSFMLPALVVAVSEDMNLVNRRSDISIGFKVKLEPDPSALLGYRLSTIDPSVPFSFLAPMVALIARCREGDEFYFDDVINQFARWLTKNNLDATVLDAIDERIATSG